VCVCPCAPAVAHQSADAALTRTTFKRLLLCCRSTHSGVPEVAFLAMQSFLDDTAASISERVVAGNLAFGDGGDGGDDGGGGSGGGVDQRAFDDAKELFEWFMKNFAGILKEERQKGASSTLRRNIFWDRRTGPTGAAPSPSSGGADGAGAGGGGAAATSAGVLSSSGDYVNGSRVDWKRTRAAHVADLKMAICGCGAFARCVAQVGTFSPADVEDILAQILACVCIFQKPERSVLLSSSSSTSSSSAASSSSASSSSSSSSSSRPGMVGAAEAADDEGAPASSLAAASSVVLQLQLREGLRKDFLPVLLRACSDFIAQVSLAPLCAWHTDPGYELVCETVSMRACVCVLRLHAVTHVLCLWRASARLLKKTITKPAATTGPAPGHPRPPHHDLQHGGAGVPSREYAAPQEAGRRAEARVHGAEHQGPSVRWPAHTHTHRRLLPPPLLSPPRRQSFACGVLTPSIICVWGVDAGNHLRVGC
jgi:hypothetical protein